MGNDMIRHGAHVCNYTDDAAFKTIWTTGNIGYNRHILSQNIWFSPDGSLGFFS